MSTKEVKKKKKVSKNQKIYWRKYTDVQDVEDFLNEKRLEERIGGPINKRKDEELFVIDNEPCADNILHSQKTKDKLTKKQRALLPPKCLELLNPLTSVPDPIVKRNRVKTKEERKSSIRKAIEERNRLNGIIPKKVLEAKKSRAITLRKKKETPKTQVFRNDVWETSNNEEKDNFEKIEWLNEDTVRHNLTSLGAFEFGIPRGIRKKKSVVPTIELPHPGTSYNPSLKDHQELISAVVEKEMEKQKKEAHIKRVTNDMFSKVTAKEKANNWIEEMSQGLPNTPEIKLEDSIKEEIEEEGGEYKAINPPVTFTKKKTKKQRRIQRLEREAALKRKEAKIEKKKKADLYKLRFIDRNIKKTESIHQKNLEKRKKLAELNVARTKRLGGRQYEEQDLDFARSCELKGNLRSLKTTGNILVDRFYSLQKRNMLVPSVKRIGKKKKVKSFIKASHKLENIENNK
ncbi:hypothetical protein O3M35_007363 [Rhynocoris fuscipes]|uniref:Ribosome biogenesis protein NOP53 n=1 Tax=Rhynocoris fuscipes TaxID=488301 RepID=A0AAW1D9T7_9HEMI